MRAAATYLAALLAVCPLTPVFAQDADEDGGGFIERWLESNLSGAGRDVQVTGFAGALSSQATLAKLTIADDDGIWFTLTNAELDWTRSALFSGRLEVTKLTADTIEITRRPNTSGGDAPVEAMQFALPALPVSVDIGEIDATKVTLGEDVLGVPVELHLAASAMLEGGAGQADMVIERTDGKQGALTLDATYDNATRNLALDLSLTEEAGGLVAAMIGLPGRDSISLTAQGEGPISDFTARISLATDEQPRLSGDVAFTSVTSPEGVPVTSFHAEVAGDVSALFLPAYRDFFGPDVRLSLDGQRLADGGLEVSAFVLGTQALQLTGDLKVNALGWPERLNVLGQIGVAGDAPVLLPMGGTETSVGQLHLALGYDAAKDEAWTLDLAAQDLSRGQIGMDTALITGAGTLTPGSNGEMPQVAGSIRLAIQGITSDDPALALALGSALQGGFSFGKSDEMPLQIGDLALQGDDYRLNGSGTIGREPDTLQAALEGVVTLVADDLSRFAALSGRPLAGAANLTLRGTATLPRGNLALEVSGSGQDLAIGQAQFDALFAGPSTLDIGLVRDATGTRISPVTINAPGVQAEASADLSAESSIITARVAMEDAAKLDSNLSGALTLDGQARRTGEAWSYTASGRAPGETAFDLQGSFEFDRDLVRRITGALTAETDQLSLWSGLAGRPLAGQASLDAEITFDPPTGAGSLTGTATSRDLALGLGEFDSLLAGEGTARLTIRRDASGVVFADEVALTTPQLSLNATGSSRDAVPTLTAWVELRDLGLVAPGLSGPFSAQADATLQGETWQITGTGSGAAGTTLRANGTIAADFARADLALAGNAPLAFANPLIAPNRVAGMASFDLRLSGPFALSSLTGRATSEGMSVALPGVGISLSPMTARLDLAGGRAQVDLSSAVSTGGQVQVNGAVTLSQPFSSDLSVSLANVGITEPGLFQTTASGPLTVSGPLSGGALISGALTLGPVEMQVPEAGFGVTGGLPDLRHIAEPADVRLTRLRAGLLGQPGGINGAGGPGYGLDIAINAPSRIFVRGRGLDAEFGGAVTLRGSTNAVVPTGGFSLIRGRLDILGRRLVINEGEITLQGSLDPTLYLAATTTAEDVTVQIIVEGRASSPSARFESTPSLPEEDVLALLIFGRGISELSPLQALQLASAVATLAGRSGGGIIGNLRQQFGLDDLDLTTDADGNVAVQVGTYINENVYTDLSVDAQGRTEIDLNLTITPNVTAKGRLSDDGSTGIGIYYERDY